MDPPLWLQSLFEPARGLLEDAWRNSTKGSYSKAVRAINSWCTQLGQPMPPSALTIQLWTCARLRQVQPQTISKELTGVATWLQNLGALADTTSDMKLMIKLLQTALGQLATTPSKASPFSPEQADIIFNALVPHGQVCSRSAARLALLFAFSLATGARTSELSRVRYPDDVRPSLIDSGNGKSVEMLEITFPASKARTRADAVKVTVPALTFRLGAMLHDFARLTSCHRDHIYSVQPQQTSQWLTPRGWGPRAPP